RAMEDVAASEGSSMRFVLFLLALGATCTLVLAAIGLYGVIAYLVSLRTREIGIRIALGLAPSRAATMIVHQGMGIIGIGALAGISVFVLSARLLRGLVFGVSTVDALSVATA